MQSIQAKLLYTCISTLAFICALYYLQLYALKDVFMEDVFLLITAVAIMAGLDHHAINI